MNARYYMPEIGRFISADTIVPEPGNPQSFNRYAYALNIPVKYVDPSGHCVLLPPIDTAACAIVAGSSIGAGTIAAGAAAVALTVAIGDAISPDFNPIVGISNGIAHAAADIGNEAEEMGKAAQKFLKNIAGNVSGNPGDFDPNDSDKSTDLIKFTSRQLQKKFDHASDFGVEGNYSEANAAEFRSALQDHIGNSSTQRIEGWYRNQQVTHYYNPDTGLNVIVGRSDNQFLSGWKLSDEQVWNLINNAGKLGGG